MPLTKRFFLMNALAMLASVALTIVAFMVFAAACAKLFGQAANLNDLKKNYEVRSGIGAIQRSAQRLDFDRLLDPSYRRDLSDQVKALGATALIVKNEKLLYATEPMNAIDLEKSLLLSDRASEPMSIELDGTNYLLARVDYPLASGDEGVLLLLAPMKLDTDLYRNLGLGTLGFFILSFILMNVWVSYRFSRGVINPVSRLRNAAVRISEGDLSGGIAEEGEGEVRELGRTLELMRIKLKESLHLQQKYDDNRKFLVSSISHDLKTPVTSIIGYIDGIMDGVARTPEQMQTYLETARSKAMLVNAMIDDLLLYAKLDLNQLPYHFETTDLLRYFQDLVADSRYEYEKANLKLSLVSELNGSVRVEMDRERLGRVVQNLLDNARKYMEKDDGRVEIRLRETRASAIIEVRDNGKGIPEEDLPHIFDRFYRADPSRKSAEGSGLGLAIAKQIVEDHAGAIWAQSTAGEGTRIMISLKKVTSRGR